MCRAEACSVHMQTTNTEQKNKLFPPNISGLEQQDKEDHQNRRVHIMPCMQDGLCQLTERFKCVCARLSAHVCVCLLRGP